MHIFNLPPELLRDVLVYLDYRSLVAYSFTCRSNYVSALSCLGKLEIAIHPSSQTTMSDFSHRLLESKDNYTDDASDRTDIVLPTERSKTHYLTIRHQNKTASNIIAKHYASLRSLDLSIWELEAETATAISQASRLQHLALRMNHPLAKVKHMPRLFWHTSPGSTVWNSFYTAPTHSFPLTPPESPCSSRSSSPAPSIPQAVFTELRTLHLERAGITDYQILRIIDENPNLVEIRLRKCLTLTDEFFRDLSNSKACVASRKRGKKQLKVLHFEMSDNPTIDDRILKYIGQMNGLEASLTCAQEKSQLIPRQSLSFLGCSNIDNKQVKCLNQTEWQISNLTLPQFEDGIDIRNIEIDPAYMF